MDPLTPPAASSLTDAAGSGSGLRQRVALVTGTLAAPALRRLADDLRHAGLVDAAVIELNIQVAALMTADWVERKLDLPVGLEVDRVILPGYCRGDVAAIERKLGVPVEIGPREMRDLPERFGARRRDRDDYGPHNLEIIAEINHASAMPLNAILALADRHRAHGADVIDVGCDPQSDRATWRGVADVVRALRDAGHRVSVDTYHRDEARLACHAGAELVLSVNSSNCGAACDWGAQVVVTPDDPHTLAGLDETVRRLERDQVPYRIDPVLEPIGLGFAASLGRYLDVRQRYPDAAMMMGVGNLTEMTEVDSAGVNMLLAGFCAEVGIGSVLTTQVINWARGSVAELDVARRLAAWAARHQSPPKHLDPRLVMLRDARLHSLDDQTLSEIKAGLRDANVRIFAGDGRIIAMSRDFHVVGDDPFVLFDAMPIDDASHAFYLGFEMAKALTAITLGKQYTQDVALDWGLLTRPEVSHHDRRSRRHGDEQADASASTDG